ncbi:MAG: DNA-directed RNA polymerase subunit H [Nanobdellota archaeon]
MADEPKRHILIPKHEKISDDEKKRLFDRYNISVKELPKIPKSDPALIGMDVKEGDVIRILRDSPTAGESIFYRGVSSE